MAEPYLIVEEQRGLVTLTMNRAEKRNPLSLAMMEELVDSLRRVGKRSEVRAVVIAGAGSAVASKDWRFEPAQLHQ